MESFASYLDELGATPECGVAALPASLAMLGIGEIRGIST
jgi:hypothetical protein